MFIKSSSGLDVKPRAHCYASRALYQLISLRSVRRLHAGANSCPCAFLPGLLCTCIRHIGARPWYIACRPGARCPRPRPSAALPHANPHSFALGHGQERPNVIVMTTSNITEAIDLAFVDRYQAVTLTGLYMSAEDCAWNAWLVGARCDSVLCCVLECLPHFVVRVHPF